MTTVLIVDDDPDIRDALSFVLEHAGYGVLMAQDGLEALERLRCERADVVLLDLMMPKMDGTTFVETVRADPDLSTIPVIVASAAPIAKPTPGVAAYFVKPFDLDRLLDVVAYLSARA
jgi:CheY-like chemotaxis protein